jgi:hypothetical protein
MEKNQSKQPSQIQNTHFIFLYPNEELKQPKKIEECWLTIKERSIKLKHEDEAEKRLKQSEDKFDKFRVWKEEFSNIEVISRMLSLPDTKYAIQLKENSYLIWKFKRKWKVMGEVFIKQNIVMTINKFVKEKKRRKKLNMLANFFDIGKHLINDANTHEMLFKENLFPLIQLHRLLHSNNNYFVSTHNKKLNCTSKRNHSDSTRRTGTLLI